MVDVRAGPFARHDVDDELGLTAQPDERDRAAPPLVEPLRLRPEVIVAAAQLVGITSRRLPGHPGR